MIEHFEHKKHEFYVGGRETVTAVLWWPQWIIVALHTNIWSAILPRFMTETAPKWGSVRRKKWWIIEHFEHKDTFMFGAVKRLRLSFDDLNEATSHCKNISGVPFFQVYDHNGTKMRIRAT
jgi:hypothetical protein